MSLFSDRSEKQPLVFFETDSCTIANADLEFTPVAQSDLELLAILLPQLPEGQDY